MDNFVPLSPTKRPQLTQKRSSEEETPKKKAKTEEASSFIGGSSIDTKDDGSGQGKIQAPPSVENISKKENISTTANEAMDEKREYFDNCNEELECGICFDAVECQAQLPCACKIVYCGSCWDKALASSFKASSHSRCPSCRGPVRVDVEVDKIEKKWGFRFSKYSKDELEVYECDEAGPRRDTGEPAAARLQRLYAERKRSHAFRENVIDRITLQVKPLMVLILGEYGRKKIMLEAEQKESQKETPLDNKETPFDDSTTTSFKTASEGAVTPVESPTDSMLGFDRKVSKDSKGGNKNSKDREEIKPFPCEGDVATSSTSTAASIRPGSSSSSTSVAGSLPVSSSSSSHASTDQSSSNADPSGNEPVNLKVGDKASPSSDGDHISTNDSLIVKTSSNVVSTSLEKRDKSVSPCSNTLPPPNCVCGSPLEKQTVRERCRATSGENMVIGGIICDLCDKSLRSKDFIWSCTNKDITMLHTGNYDVCNKCFEHYSQNTMEAEKVLQTALTELKKSDSEKKSESSKSSIWTTADDDQKKIFEEFRRTIADIGNPNSRMSRVGNMLDVFAGGAGQVPAGGANNMAQLFNFLNANVNMENGQMIVSPAQNGVVAQGALAPGQVQGGSVAPGNANEGNEELVQPGQLQNLINAGAAAQAVVPFPPVNGSSNAGNIGPDPQVQLGYPDVENDSEVFDDAAEEDLLDDLDDDQSDGSMDPDEFNHHEQIHNDQAAEAAILGDVMEQDPEILNELINDDPNMMGILQNVFHFEDADEDDHHDAFASDDSFDEHEFGSEVTFSNDEDPGDEDMGGPGDNDEDMDGDPDADGAPADGSAYGSASEEGSGDSPSAE